MNEAVKYYYLDLLLENVKIRKENKFLSYMMKCNLKTCFFFF